MQILNDSDAPSDERTWYFRAEDGKMTIHLANDADSIRTTIRIERQGTTVTSIEVDGEAWDVQT